MMKFCAALLGKVGRERLQHVTAILAAVAITAPVAAEGIIPRERLATADREGKFSGDPARRTMDQFAACVLDRKRKLVLKALSMPSDSPEQNEIFGRLAKTECIADAQMHFNGPAFRGGLYKALVRKQFGRIDVFPAPAAGADVQVSIPDENGTGFVGEAGFLKFASCVIHRDPQNARDVILSTAGSPKEDEGMAALANVFGQCLYAGTTLHLSKGGLIGFLAQAYYREASAAAEDAAAR